MRPRPQSQAEVDAEARVLTTPAGQALLAAMAEVAEPSPAEIARWRKEASAELVAAALRLAQCRRKGETKFARAAQMWLEPIALEQATAEPVAQHKAKRFASALAVDVCAGLGGDTVALAKHTHVMAVDRDMGLCRRCKWNAEVYEVGDRIEVVCAQAESIHSPAGALIHIDPDRRATSKRARALSVRDYEPGLSFLHELIRKAPGGAIKLSPASDFQAHFDESRFEIELVSLHGECKEATVWFGGLANSRRRATCLPTGATWAVDDISAIKTGRRTNTETLALAEWLFVPDPALDRAGLLDHFAAAHDLLRVRRGVDLLTGRQPVDSPFLTMYAVLAELPLDLRHLRKALAERLLGQLEIVPRGLSLPENYLRTLRARGPNRATLFCVGGPGPRRAILAERALG